MYVQSLIFSKDYFTKRQAQAWVREHGYKQPKIDETERSYRFRQLSPKDFKKHSFRTITFGDGVKAIIGIPMKKRRNSSVRMDEIASDLAMIAQKEGIPRARKVSKVAKTVFGDALEKTNPQHFPKTKRGRPTNNDWWILDLFDSKEKKITTLIGRGTKTKATHEARTSIGNRTKGRGASRARVVRSALLSGPYRSKPNTRTPRK